jgi:polyferredoxin
VLRLHSVCSPVFHCNSCPWALFACPIGVLAHFSALHVFPFIAIGTLVAVGAVFGSFVCGWACPFGFLQDLIGRIPTPKFELPGSLGHLRYGVLVVFVLAIPFLFGEEHPLLFCSLCPAGALEAALARGIWPSAAKTTILVVILIAMFFKWRPWCTLFCPLGAIFGLSNRASILFLRFHPKQCTDCGRCRQLCRYRGRSENRTSELRCIRCLECTDCEAITVSTVFGRPKEATEG